jgi:flagellar hook-associated protein 2
MAGITAAGIGSGLDINGLVTQLVSAERQPQTNRLNSAQEQVQAQLSAMGTYRSALSAMQTSLKALADGSVFTKQAVASADATVLTATADGTAVSGTYAVEVMSLAHAHKLGSQAYASSSTAIGTGTLTIAVGADSFSINITSGSDSVSAIRDAINAATDNTGVRATVINSTDGAHLVLTSTATGVDKALRVTTSGGDGGLADLVYDPGVTTTLSELQPATNGQVRVDGYLFESSTNSISGAVEGVTINLAKEQPGGSVNLTVSADTKAITDAVTGFVSSYNALTATIATVTAYNPTTKQAAALMGDPALQSASQQLRRIVGGQVTGIGAIDTLAAIGITSKVDGTLALDSTKFNTAVADDLSSVKALFSGTDGIATRLNSNLTGYLDVEGPIQARTDGANRKLKDIQTQRDALARRMDSLESNYRKQFTALDSLISQLQSTGDYLTSQLSSLANLNSNN